MSSNYISSSLSALLSWYREEVDAAIPQRIHSKDIDRGGAPEWHGAFRRYLTAPATAEDKEGALSNPLAYWVWTMPKRRRLYLERLAYMDFDWRWTAQLHGVLDQDAAYDYTIETLRRLRRRMYGDDGQPRDPRRMLCNEHNCWQAPLRGEMYCKRHAKEGQPLTVV